MNFETAKLIFEKMSLADLQELKEEPNFCLNSECWAMFRCVLNKKEKESMNHGFQW